MLKNENRYRDIFVHTPDYLVVYRLTEDEDILVVDANPAAISRYLAGKEDYLGKSLYEVNPRVDKTPIPDMIREVHRERRPRIIPLDYYEDTMVPGWFSFSFFPISGKEVACVIKEETEMEAKLRRESRMFQAFIDEVPDRVFFKDGEHRFLRVNKAKAAEFGLEPEDLIGKSDRDFYAPEVAEACLADDRKVFATGTSIENREEHLVHQGGECWVLTSKLPILDESGRIIGTMGNARDITVAKDREVRLESLVSEKDQLIREIHHRTRNNFTLLTSLINLYSEDGKGEKSLEELRNKIDTFRMLHDILQEPGNLSEVEISGYLTNIIQAVMSEAAMEIKPVVDVASVHMPSKAAVNLGLIVNEAATNAIKYGFGQGRKNLFWVTLKPEDGNGRCIVEIGNDGEPIPESVDVDKPKSVGLSIIHALASQMGGKIEIERAPTPKIRIVIEDCVYAEFD